MGLREAKQEQRAGQTEEKFDVDSAMRKKTGNQGTK